MADRRGLAAPEDWDIALGAFQALRESRVRLLQGAAEEAPAGPAWDLSPECPVFLAIALQAGCSLESRRVEGWGSRQSLRFANRPRGVPGCQLCPAAAALLQESRESDAVDHLPDCLGWVVADLVRFVEFQVGFRLS